MPTSKDTLFPGTVSIYVANFPIRQVMKILFVNPHVDATHEAVEALQVAGFAVVIAKSAEEGKQLLPLHGGSLDLVLVHREDAGGQGQDGFKFAKTFKEGEFSDVPFIISTQKWTEEECAKHQTSDLGANAYLLYPFDITTLVKTVQEVLSLQTDEPTQVGSADVTMVASAQDFTGALPGLTRVFKRDPEEEEEATRAFNPELVAPPEFTSPGVPSVEKRLEGFEPPKLEATDAGAPAAPKETTLGGGEDPKDTLSGIEIPVLEDPTETSFRAKPSSEPVQKEQTQTKTKTPPPAPPEASLVMTPTMTSVKLPEPTMAEAAPPEPTPPPIEKEEQTLTPTAIRESRDKEAEEQMPYLFEEPQEEAAPSGAGIAHAPPVGDAVVPGGAAQAPDTETLKKYLLLREQDVSALSSQLRSAKEQIASLEDLLSQERRKTTELEHVIEVNDKRIGDFEKEKSLAIETVNREAGELRFQLKSKTDKARILESKVKESIDELENLKNRVRQDIRKIRFREKELENQLEIVRKDSEALLTLRESKIVDLKRKLDLAEFNMDLLQDQFSREKEKGAKLNDRLSRIAQAMRVAGGFLGADEKEITDLIDEAESESSDEERKVS